MNYQPETFSGGDFKQLIAYLQRELNRIAAAGRDNADTLFYRTLPVPVGNLSANAGNDWKLPQGNVYLISTSNTLTVTGIYRLLAAPGAGLERVLVNVGTGQLVLKSQGTESSASNRLALSGAITLGGGAAAVLWRDQAAARWRALGHT